MNPWVLAVCLAALTPHLPVPPSGPRAAIAPHPRYAAFTESQLRAYDGRVYDGLPAYPRCRSQADTTRAMEECLGQEFKAAVGEEARVEEVLLAFLDPKARAELVQEQQTAQRLAESDCATQLERFQGGSLANTVYVACRVCETRLRTRALESYLDWTVIEHAAQRRAERARWKKGQPELCEE